MKIKLGILFAILIFLCISIGFYVGRLDLTSFLQSRINAGQKQESNAIEPENQKTGEETKEKIDVQELEKGFTLSSSTPIEKKDFMMTNGKEAILLDMPHAKCKLGPEIKKENLGQFYYGDYVYQFYLYEYNGFTTCVSNAKYIDKNRKYDELYVVNVTVKSPVLKTRRGVSVGSKEEDIVKKYGLGKETKIQNGNKKIAYSLDDMELSFSIGKSGVVEEIIMEIPM